MKFKLLWVKRGGAFYPILCKKQSERCSNSPVDNFAGGRLFLIAAQEILSFNGFFFIPGTKCNFVVWQRTIYASQLVS